MFWRRVNSLPCSLLPPANKNYRKIALSKPDCHEIHRKRHCQVGQSRLECTRRPLWPFGRATIYCSPPADLLVIRPIRSSWRNVSRRLHLWRYLDVRRRGFGLEASWICRIVRTRAQQRNCQISTYFGGWATAVGIGSLLLISRFL